MNTLRLIRKIGQSSSQYVLILLALTACQPGTGVLVSECVLPPDQVGTINGRWATPPVAVARVQGQFDSVESQSIRNAAGTWNAFYLRAQGFNLIDMQEQESERGPAQNLCAVQLSDGDSVPVIKIFNGWPAAQNQAIGITKFCFTEDGTSLPQIYNAQIELNYQDFFNEGQKQPDLQSIALHEFGHLVGLNHSCETANINGVPNCNDPNISRDYFFAAMFPVVLFQNETFGEVRRALQTNDQGRANCLYDDVVAGGGTSSSDPDLEDLTQF